MISIEGERLSCRTITAVHRRCVRCFYSHPYKRKGDRVKLEDACRVISAAEKKAREIGQPMNIAVTDEVATS